MSKEFTRSARAVIVNAVARAHGEGALLAAVMGDPATQPLMSEVNQLPDAGILLAEVRQARRRGGVSAVEADALAELGIDVKAVVGRVEAELGEGALDDRRGPARRGLRLAMSAKTRLVVQAARRQASARGDRELAAEHLLLALLAQRGLVADTLASRGVTVATVLAALDARAAPGVSTGGDTAGR